MQRALFLYSSQDGQTIKILKHIEQALSASHQCDIRNLHQSLDIDVNAYDQVLIGGAVRYGHLHSKLYEFIEKHHVALTNRQAGFFCVNLTARKAGKDTPEGSVYMRKFLKRSKWQPQTLAVFAGALCYPKYVWYDRLMIQLIMKITGGETDATKEVEYTNWEQVSNFAHQFGLKSTQIA